MTFGDDIAIKYRDFQNKDKIECGLWVAQLNVTNTLNFISSLKLQPDYCMLKKSI